MKSACDILLVDDDADDAELALHALDRGKLSFTVHHIDDGQTALDYLLDPAVPLPKLVLLDLRMPKVDGITVLRKLRDEREGRKILVVALISSPEGKRYLESFGVSADGYLVKPIDTAKLLHVLNELGIMAELSAPSQNRHS